VSGITDTTSLTSRGTITKGEGIGYIYILVRTGGVLWVGWLNIGGEAGVKQGRGEVRYVPVFWP